MGGPEFRDNQRKGTSGYQQKPDAAIGQNRRQHSAPCPSKTRGGPTAFGQALLLTFLAYTVNRSLSRSPDLEPPHRPPATGTYNRYLRQSPRPTLSLHVGQSSRGRTAALSIYGKDEPGCLDNFPRNFWTALRLLLARRSSAAKNFNVSATIRAFSASRLSGRFDIVLFNLLSFCRSLTAGSPGNSLLFAFNAIFERQKSNGCAVTRRLCNYYESPRRPFFPFRLNSA